MSTTLPATNYKIDFGPYSNSGEAGFCLGRFTDAALGPDFGIIYCDDNAATLLRAPQLDQQGKGFVLVARYTGLVAPQDDTPQKPQGFWASFVDMMTQVNAERTREHLANIQAQYENDELLVNAVSDWLANKTTEHGIGLAIDLLGIASYALLFVPVVGEADLTIMAAYRAAEALKMLRAGAIITGRGAAIGGALGAYVDGKYLCLRIFDGSNDALTYDGSQSADVISAVSALLSLPDMIVGGILLAKDVPELIAETNRLAAQAAAKAQQANAMAQKVGVVAQKAASSADSRVQQLSARLLPTAQRQAALLAKRASELTDDLRGLNLKLKSRIFLSGSSTYIGAPVAESYALHDHSAEMSNMVTSLRQSILSLLGPVGRSATSSPANLSLQVAATSRSSR